MYKFRESLCLVAFAVVAGAGSARGGDDRLPLLVVVEADSGAGVDASEIRRTIGAELGRPVVAPEEAMAGAAANVLIVAVEKTEIRMSFRASSAGLVSRAIPAPLDRPARLREIGWLAGNLARDQVSGIVALPAESPVQPSNPTIAAADIHAPTEPSPVVPALREPETPAAVVYARPVEAAGERGSRWAITAATGPLAYIEPTIGPHVLTDADQFAYQIEVQRQVWPDSFIVGAALEVSGGYVGAELLGVAAFVGSSWRHRSWFLETTAGIGIEAAQVYSTNTTRTDSSITGASGTTTLGSATRPALFLRGVGTVGLPITASLDLVAKFGVHLASGGLANDFVSATAGLRFSLP